MAEDNRTKFGAAGPERPPSHPATQEPPVPPIDHSKSYLPPAAPQVDPLLGQTLAGRYLIARKLGEGGMGAVYLATHLLLEKQVALKVLHSEFSRKTDLVERFMQEAKAASRIRHENVIDISDFGATPDGIVFFAMELLDGHDLHEDVARARLAGQLLPYARSKKIFLQICSALSAAHAKGIIHRDLKPENIYLVDFLGDPDFVKLLDFGIAKVTEVSENDRKLTRTGMLFGTPEYMSPEQARGEQVDHRVDVYSMGCILFQLVTGRVPFEADNFMGVLSLHLTEQPPIIPEAVFDRIGAPRQLAQVIDAALAKDRAARWQTIDDLANAVRSASGDALVDRNAPISFPRAPSVPAPERTTEARPVTPIPPPTSTPPPIRQTSETRQRTQWTGNLHVPEATDGVPLGPSRVPLILGGIALVAVAAGAVYFATRGDSSSPPIVATAPPDGPAARDAAIAPDATIAIATVTVDAAPPTVPVPEWAELTLASRPPGAKVTDLLTGSTFPAPKTLRMKGSATPRQFQFVLRGYSDAIVEITPNQPKLSHVEVLQKGVSGTVTPPGPGSATPTIPIDAKPPDPVRIDAGIPVDDCPELPCGIKADPSRIKCSSDDACGDGQKCVGGFCK